ncbi:MAG: hypothetical protein Tsb0013_05400 [Phycisphaerales bacterium]
MWPVQAGGPDILSVMHHLSMSLTVALLAFAPALTPALGQPAADDPDEALVPGDAQEDVVLRPTQSGEVAPVLDLPDPRPPRGAELPEGTFITDAQGIVVPLTTGGWAFVFDEDVNGEADPPMVLQPSMQTAAMLRLVSAREDTMTFAIAGEVQRYRGRHYLLPLRFDVVSGDGSTDRRPAEERAAQAERELGETPDGADVTADELEARVERLSDEDRPSQIPSATAPGDSVGGAGATSIVPENSLVIDLSGRVERDGSGLWVFTSDNDADTPPEEGGLSGAITLVPCLMLQALERDLMESPGRARLRISGRVLVFEGSNFLLPTLYRLTPDVNGNLTSAQ